MNSSPFPTVPCTPILSPNDQYNLSPFYGCVIPTQSPSPRSPWFLPDPPQTPAILCGNTTPEVTPNSWKFLPRTEQSAPNKTCGKSIKISIKNNEEDQVVPWLPSPSLKQNGDDRSCFPKNRQELSEKRKLLMVSSLKEEGKDGIIPRDDVVDNFNLFNDVDVDIFL